MTDRAPAPLPRINSSKKKGNVKEAGVVTTVPKTTTTTTSTTVATATFTTVASSSPSSCAATTSTSTTASSNIGAGGDGSGSSSGNNNLADGGKDTVTKTRHCTSLPLFYSSNNAVSEWISQFRFHCKSAAAVPAGVVLSKSRAGRELHKMGSEPRTRADPTCTSCFGVHFISLLSSSSSQ